ncbi:MAG: AraC family transcriptional regulator [Tepidisphaeraceae bacterium]
MRKLLWKNIVAAGAHLHVARLNFPDRARGAELHSHDFAEVFWLERGRAWHRVNGRRRALVAGDMVLIRPPDSHAFALPDDAGVTMVNVAFAARSLHAVRERYFAKADHWPWDGDELPTELQLTPGQLAQLRAWSDALAAGRLSRLDLDWFLINLLRLITSGMASSAPALDRPDWLDRALAQFEKPEHFARGVGELARLSGRCPEHLNRVVRACFNKTATDLANDVRMEYAGRELGMTNRPILDLAYDCGISNLGYFYRLFRERYGMTPRQFRLRRQAVVR